MRMPDVKQSVRLERAVQVGEYLTLPLHHASLSRWRNVTVLLSNANLDREIEAPQEDCSRNSSNFARATNSRPDVSRYSG